MVNGSNPLTGTTEERQARMDELCRSLKEYRDLNSLRNGVSPTSTFKMQFDGFQSELKRPTEFSPDNRGMVRSMVLIRKIDCRTPSS